MKPSEIILINTSIGAFICILYRYEERLFQEMCALYINIETDIYLYVICLWQLILIIQFMVSLYDKMV